MNKRKISVGVIGVGHLGAHHAKLYAGIQDVHLVGVFDIDSQKADHAAVTCGTKAYQSMEALLRDADAVSIVTPTSAHFSVASAAIREGKDVFIEKPITSTVEDARELSRLASKQKTIIQVGHIERFNPALLALEKYNLAPMFIESHRLAQFNPRGTDVAVVLDLMIHDIDIILSLVRSDVRDIQANGVPVVSDSVDIANARLLFDNGCVANVTASRISQKKMRKMRMFQKDTYISVDFSDGVAEVFRLADADGDSGSGGMLLGEIGAGAKKKMILYEQPEIKELNALEYELKLFIGCVRDRTAPVVTSHEATLALDVAHRIMDRIREQRLPA